MTKLEIIARLRALSAEMITVGTAMNYYAGLSDGEMAQHGVELVGAGLIASEWGDELEKAPQ